MWWTNRPHLPQSKCYRLADGIQKNKMGPARCLGDKVSQKDRQTRKLLQGFAGFLLGYINCSRSELNLLPVSWSSCKQQGCAGLVRSPCGQMTAPMYVLPVSSSNRDITAKINNSKVPAATAGEHQ